MQFAADNAESDVLISCETFMMMGFEPPPFDDYLKRIPGMRRMFPGLRRFDEHMGSANVYCKFELGGSHNEQLLRIFRVPDKISADIRREWRRAPRLNVPPSHKQVAALLSVEWLSRKLDVDLSRKCLLTMFAEHGVEVDDDFPCALMGRDLKIEQHKRMLKLAREAGFDPYVHFFQDEEIDGPVIAPSTGPEIFSTDDLHRLAEK